MLAEGECITA